jgi:hypothetical protein
MTVICGYVAKLNALTDQGRSLHFRAGNSYSACIKGREVDFVICVKHYSAIEHAVLWYLFGKSAVR